MKSHYHVSIGSMLRQEKIQKERRKSRKRKLIFFVISSALIIAAIFFSSHTGISSYIAIDSRPAEETQFVIVEFKTIYVMDDDPQWIKGR